jgi:hypothetical protein
MFGGKSPPIPSSSWNFYLILRHKQDYMLHHNGRHEQQEKESFQL